MASDSRIPVPSGQPVTLQEVIRGTDAQPDSWFFRFLAPELAPGFDYAAVEPDLKALCQRVALTQLRQGVRRVVISLSDRPLAFGTPAPDAVQVFEAYAVGDGTCEWEPF